LSAIAIERAVRAPALVILGQVVALHERLAWCEPRAAAADGTDTLSSGRGTVSAPRQL